MRCKSISPLLLGRKGGGGAIKTHLAFNFSRRRPPSGLPPSLPFQTHPIPSQPIPSHAHQGSTRLLSQQALLGIGLPLPRTRCVALASQSTLCVCVCGRKRDQRLDRDHAEG
ncbi:hypothetical protein IE53DRAFT_252306 [Violaceomyces palustris]|uniref:Uncharacterized protein n=1 Tax=Violaceomyces palustris TaxID=1673888 RepID=A0ACD0P441_9BASI|nr:hypothetical protein IE53DRAFT_252306 [Violaceomyces palustris]